MRWWLVFLLGCDAVASSGASKVAFVQVERACVEDATVEFDVPGDAAGLMVERVAAYGDNEGHANMGPYTRSPDGVLSVACGDGIFSAVRVSWLEPR